MDYITSPAKNGIERLFDLFESVAVQDWKREGNGYCALVRYDNRTNNGHSRNIKGHFFSIDITHGNLSSVERGVLANASMRLDNGDILGDYILRMRLYEILDVNGQETPRFKLEMMNPLSKDRKSRAFEIYNNIRRLGNN